MKRLIFLFAAGVAALALILIIFFPSLVVDLADLMPATLPTPPKGFDVRREGIERGKVETVEYDSKAAGCQRKMCVYTPPGFSKDQKYPVLYLLHGSLSDETSWAKDGAADTILDNLYADKKPVPMIVVMPNGNLSDVGDAFGADLQDDIIPYVEKHFPVKADREHRALAGVSAGAYQTLNSGLPRPDTFAYLGVFIGGLGMGLGDCDTFEKKHQEVLKDLGTKKKLKLLWVANGKHDLTYENCQDTLKLFDKYKIQYVYVEGKGLHGWETARNDLFIFAPLVFRDAKWGETKGSELLFGSRETPYTTPLRRFCGTALMIALALCPSSFHQKTTDPPKILLLLLHRNKQPRCPSGQISVLKSPADLLESRPHDAPFSARPHL